MDDWTGIIIVVAIICFTVIVLSTIRLFVVKAETEKETASEKRARAEWELKYRPAMPYKKPKCDSKE